MRKLINLNCIITADPNSKNIYVLSTREDRVALPYFEISSPKFLYNEIRYNIKSMFDNIIKFLEEIIISFVDIQNLLVFDLLEKHKDTYHVNLDEDVILLTGLVLHEKMMSDSLYWVPIHNVMVPTEISSLDTEDIHLKVVRYVFEKIIV